MIEESKELSKRKLKNHAFLERTRCSENSNLSYWNAYTISNFGHWTFYFENVTEIMFGVKNTA